jgi:hypothetical protein
MFTIEIESDWTAVDDYNRIPTFGFISNKFFPYNRVCVTWGLINIIWSVL